LYGPGYAERYRAADEQIRGSALVLRFSAWLQQICDSFGREITALDLGCGTGRYFAALSNVRELVAVDVSAHMLEHARTRAAGPDIAVGRITFVEGDFLNQAFTPGQFDLVYSVGVLGEHSPFDRTIAGRVHEWLAPQGAFAFTAVHPFSFSVPRTWQRRLGEWLLPISVGGMRRRLRERLLAGGLYADEQWVRDVLTSTGFTVESITPFESDVHLHLLTLARKL
jgi:SAM-dependent methyltransferase